MRLRYSFQTYLRKMQISRYGLFVFVEGYTDRYFFSTLMNSISTVKDPHNIVTAAELLDEEAGGKKKLLSFFDFLKKRDALNYKFKKKRKLSCFFLDKDVDDLMGNKSHSKHLIYTRTYALENYFYMYGDIVKAASIAASLDMNSVAGHIGQPHDWRKKAATSWKEWIVLCVLSLKNNKEKPICNYGYSKSPIHDGVYGPVNKRKYAECISIIKKRSGYSDQDFNRKLKKIAMLINKIYSDENFDSIFKGAWYTPFLIEDVRKIAQKKQYSPNALGDRLLDVLTSTLDFNDAWTNDFKRPVLHLLRKR